MKALKKLSCVLLAVLLLMSLTVTAFAASGDPNATDTTGPVAPGEVYPETKTFEIKIDEPLADHSFEAYQIFSGKLYGEEAEGGTDEIMTDIEWGFGLTPTGIGVVKEALELPETATAQDAAKKLADGALTADALATKLAADKAANLKDPKALTRNADGGYYFAEVTTGYYMIIDSITSEVPGENQAVSDYIVQVVDNVDMKPKSDVPSVEKKVQDVNDSEATVAGSNPTGWQDSADYDIGDHVPFQLKATLPSDYGKYTTYELVFHDKSEHLGTPDEGSVKYSVNGVETTPVVAPVVNTAPGDDDTFDITIANVHEAFPDAVAGSTIEVQYTAVLLDGAVIGGTGNPNTVYLEYSNDSNGTGTGKTTEDKVVVFTFDVVVDKEDEENNPLPGAAFKLEKKLADGSWKEIKAYTVEDALTTFEFSGVDDGIYRLSETATPAGYNSIDPIYFKVTAEHSQDPTPELTNLTIVQTNEAGVALGDADVTAHFTVETVSSGTGTTTIVNQHGLELPETGGIGTTIFYAVGGVLVAAALVLLITKKRMTKEG